MTLHDAILEALKNLGNQASSRELADYINSKKLYQRGDLRPLEASQVRARVGNYLNLFSIDPDNKISAIDNKNPNKVNLALILVNILRSGGHNIQDADLIICALLVYARRANISLAHQYEISSLHKIGDFFQSLNFEVKEIQLIESSYQSMPTHILRRLIDVTDNLSELHEKEFRELYQNWLNITSKSQVRSGQFNTPGKVNNIICSLVEGDLEFKRVLDPFAGSATTVVFLKTRFEDLTNYQLQDIDLKAVVMGKLNLLANEVETYSYQQKNSFTSFPEGKFDLIVSNPPLGQRVDPYQLKIDRDIDFSGILGSNSIPSEVISFKRIINSLSSTGQAIIVVPENFLFSNQKILKTLKTDLVKSGYISKIISLPVGAYSPYAGVKTSIVVIDMKGANSRDTVDFIDITLEAFKSIPEDCSNTPIKFDNCATISLVEIEENEFNLTTNRYTLNAPLDDDKKYVPLSELIIAFKQGKAIDKNYLNNVEGIPYVSIKDLARPQTSPFLILDRINLFVEDSLSVKKKYKENFLLRNSILIAKAGTNLYPTIYADDKPVLVNPNVLHFYVKTDKVDSQYLVLQLQESYVVDQLDKFRGGTTIPFLSTADLEKILIWLPSLDEQRQIVNKKFSEFIVHGEGIRNKNDEELNLQIIETFKHEFGNLKNPLLANVKTLHSFMSSKFDLENENISERPGSQTVQRVFDGINHIAGEMGAIIEDMVDALSSNPKLTKVSILDFFATLTVKLGTKTQIDIQIEDSISPEYCFNIDPQLLCKAFRNLVINAEKHGYDEDQAEKNILFKLSKSEDEQLLEINYINDGKPFKEGFTFNDFISFGKKTSATSGSGIGGFLINKIIKEHEGTFEEVPLNNTNLVEAINNKEVLKGLHFLIRIPLINDENIN